MKFNKALNDVHVSSQTRKYINNYINESIKSMKEKGYVEEFIWIDLHKGDDKLNADILHLLNKDIITFGNYNADGILIPVSKEYDGVERNGIIVLHYMLSDNVLKQNGFKTPLVKE